MMGPDTGPHLLEVKRISTTEPRLNDQIRAQRCRLISDEGEQLGIFMVSDALRIAGEQGLDLVEIAPTADPPVCKTMDYGKYKYEMEQKAKKARKNQTRIEVKEIKFRPKIDTHDYETKKKHVVRFLEAGAKVKVTIMFRGREMVHAERGLAILERLQADIADLAFVESRPKLEGRNMFMLLAPHKKEPVKEKVRLGRGSRPHPACRMRRQSRHRLRTRLPPALPRRNRRRHAQDEDPQRCREAFQAHRYR